MHPGDHIPTIPAHRLKASFDYDVTDQWKVGADVVLASSQYFFGDESNQNPQLPGYGVVNLRTSYEMEKGVTLYGLITNVFDHKYATYGAFYDTGIHNVSGQALHQSNEPGYDYAGAALLRLWRPPPEVLSASGACAARRTGFDPPEGTAVPTGTPVLGRKRRWRRR